MEKIQEKKHVLADFLHFNFNPQKDSWDFLGGAVDKNPPANAGDMGLSPGPGRSHMPRNN